MSVDLRLGDCLDVMGDLEDGCVDAVVTDPPYGVTSLPWDVRVENWLPAIDRVLKPSGSAWIFGSLLSLAPLIAKAEAGELGPWLFSHEVIWEKHNGSNFHADRFRRVHEIAAHFYRGKWGDVYRAPVFTQDATSRTVRSKGRPTHTGHIDRTPYQSEDGGPRLQRSVIHVRSCHGSAVHPTQKPTGILRPLIEYACPPGGLVLDPFAGSGSTGVAARETGRDALLIEIDPDYHRAAQSRLDQLVIDIPAAAGSTEPAEAGVS